MCKSGFETNGRFQNGILQFYFRVGFDLPYAIPGYVERAPNGPPPLLLQGLDRGLAHLTRGEYYKYVSGN